MNALPIDKRKSSNTINIELEDFFKNSKNQKKVVSDADKFKEKIAQVGVPYQKLETAIDISNITSALMSGMGVSGITALGWFSSLSILGKLGFGFGMVAAPWWVAFAGVSGAMAVWITSKALRSIDKKANKKVPLFINSPLDLLGDQIFKIISASILCTLGKERYENDESKSRATEYFVLQWGFDHEYVKTLYSEISNDKSNQSIDRLSIKLKRLKETKDINLKPFVKEIVSAIDGIIGTYRGQLDGAIQRLEKLKNSLK